MRLDVAVQEGQPRALIDMKILHAEAAAEPLSSAKPAEVMVMVALERFGRTGGNEVAAPCWAPALANRFRTPHRPGRPVKPTFAMT